MIGYNALVRDEAAAVPPPVAPSTAPTLLALTADELLAMAPDEPERLFGIDPQHIKQDYRALAAHWHPDACQDPRAGEVMGRIATLYGTAQIKLRAGAWSPPGMLMVEDAKTRKSAALPIILKREFELGLAYICNENLAFRIDSAHAERVKKTARLVGGLSYANDAMREQMARHLPGKPSLYEAADHVFAVLPRNPELVSLRDAMAAAGGSVPPEHIAWIVSSLLNTACYLRWAGLTHNDLSLDTVFVSPEHHYCAVLGGWWYATPLGERMTALPTRSAVLAPADVIHSTEADPRVDLDLIRAIGRELSGDPDGLSSMAASGAFPAPLASWLGERSDGTATDDYRVYKDKVLPESFGPRRFVKWAISPTTIYQPRR